MGSLPCADYLQLCLTDRTFLNRLLCRKVSDAIRMENHLGMVLHYVRNQLLDLAQQSLANPRGFIILECACLVQVFPASRRLTNCLEDDVPECVLQILGIGDRPHLIHHGSQAVS